MTRKIIISIDDKISDETAVERCLAVIRGGLVSGSGDKAQYCYVSVFPDKTHVYVRKYGSGTQRFDVRIPKSVTRNKNREERQDDN